MTYSKCSSTYCIVEIVQKYVFKMNFQKLLILIFFNLWAIF